MNKRINKKRRRGQQKERFLKKINKNLRKYYCQNSKEIFMKKNTEKKEERKKNKDKF